MSNWFHEARGKYDIADRWIGIDYGKLFLDPQATNLTLAHEACHGVIAMTEFGQATHVVYRLIEDFNHLNQTEKKEMGQLLYNSQLFVQEGLATFLQISQLRRATDKTAALAWAQNELPPDYLERLQKLLFAFDWMQRYRDFFTSKLCDLSMETGIRRTASELDLFGKLENLKSYLLEADNNPDLRMEKVIAVLKYKPWLVTKPLPEIAKVCGITYHEFTTKKEVVGFLNYLHGFTDSKRVFIVADIGNTPKGADAFIAVTENMIVGNMNINLTDPTDTLFNFDDFLFYADKIEILFVSPYEDSKNSGLIKGEIGTDPEVNLAGFLPIGEKYLSVTSRDRAEKALNNELSNATLFVKWEGGSFNPLTNQLIWSSSARPPDLVIYNRPQTIKKAFTSLIKQNPKISFKHLYAGAMQNHPIQTLLIQIEGRNSIHAVNGLFSKGIGEVLKVIKSRSEVMSNAELRKNKKHINNLLALWMGLDWRIDWVESMLDGGNLILRKNN